jgi:hypothetical protein
MAYGDDDNQEIVGSKLGPAMIRAGSELRGIDRCHERVLAAVHITLLEWSYNSDIG